MDMGDVGHTGPDTTKADAFQEARTKDRLDHIVVRDLYGPRPNGPEVIQSDSAHSFYNYGLYSSEVEQYKALARDLGMDVPETEPCGCGLKHSE